MIVAIDPGGYTGVAMQNGHGHFSCYSFGPDEHHLELFQFLVGLPKADLTIICEKFDFRQGKQDNVELISREYIGIIKLACERWFLPLHMQSAAQAKGLITDDKLKRADVFQVPPSTKPNKDINDAYRHLLYYKIVTQQDLKLTEVVSGKV